MLGMPTKKYPCQKYKVLQTWHCKALNSWLTSVYINLVFQSKFSAAKIKHKTDKETPHDDVTEGTFEWRGVGNNVKHYLSYSLISLYWADSIPPCIQGSDSYLSLLRQEGLERMLAGNEVGRPNVKKI